MAQVAAREWQGKRTAEESNEADRGDEGATRGRLVGHRCSARASFLAVCGWVGECATRGVWVLEAVAVACTVFILSVCL